MPVVFISYSHDSPDHLNRILDLSNQLRASHIDCQIDQYQESPPEGWPRWCENQIEAAEFVLVACTETYLRRYKGKEKPATGRGATWEGHVITQELYNAQSHNAKFIPIIFAATDEANVPLPLQSATIYNLPDSYDALHRRLTHQPFEVRPIIGAKLMPPHQKTPPLLAVKRPTHGRVDEFEQPQSEARPVIFISYSHRDRKIKESLQRHLRVLEIEDLIEDSWDDTRLHTGDEWYPAIERAIDRSNVTILLISVDFLTSGFILNDEVRRLLARRNDEGLRVYPIFVRHCAWQKVKWLSKFHVRTWNGQPLPGGRAGDKALAGIATEIAELFQTKEPIRSPSRSER